MDVCSWVGFSLSTQLGFGGFERIDLDLMDDGSSTFTVTKKMIWKLITTGKMEIDEYEGCWFLVVLGHQKVFVLELL